MRKVLIMLMLLFASRATAQWVQCPLRWMYQYYPPAQFDAAESIKDDSDLAYLVALINGFPSPISPTVGWYVGVADSFSVNARTTDSILVTIQHDGLYGSFVIDTTIVGPFYWHAITVHVTPGAHNYSMQLYPGTQTGPPRHTVFGVPVYFGAAYQWSTTAGVNVSEIPNSSKPRYYDELGRERTKFESIMSEIGSNIYLVR